jgi:uncharacterized protein
MKKVLLLLLLLKSITPIFGQSPTAQENSLLWKITGNGLANASYLYGTIHVIPRKDFFLTDSTLRAFDYAEKIAFEFDLKKELKFLPQLRLMSKMRMRGDTTLDMLMSEEDYDFVKSKFLQKRIPMRLVNRLKPTLISDFASGNLDEMKNGSTTSYEMEFLARAKRSKKKITGLETAAYQMSVFDSIPYHTQAQMMLEELRSDGSESNREYKRLLKIYKRQDLESIQKVINSDEEQTSNFNTILLDNRNRNWIPVIEKLSKKSKMFYAIGAGHLVGENGVIALLRKRGYILTPIR